MRVVEELEREKESRIKGLLEGEEETWKKRENFTTSECSEAPELNALDLFQKDRARE